MKKKFFKSTLDKYIAVSAVIHIFIISLSSGFYKCSNDEIILPPSVQVDLIAPDFKPATQPQLPEKPTPEPPPETVSEPEKQLPDKEEPKKQGPTVDLEQEKKKKEEAKKKKLAEEKKKAEKRKKAELEKKRKAEKKKKEEERKKQEQRKKQAQKVQQKQNEALNKLKQNEALKKLQQKAQPATGKRLNPGTSFSGLDSIQFQKYYGEIKDHLFNNWSLPQWLSELNLKAQALVVLDGNGYVVKREIIQTSGNANFDNTVLSAIDRASPFPVAPSRLKDKVENKEIVFGFPEN